MILAADATGRRELTGSAPRNKPGFHVLVGDVMSGLDLPTRLADFLLLAIFHRGLPYSAHYAIGRYAKHIRIISNRLCS
jgi:hypothetical protein